jgi:hypothetical protein
LVQNCGFETGDFTGWTLSGDLRYTFVSNSPVNSGTFAAWFAGGDLSEFGLPGFTAFMDQTIAAVPGSSLNLSFALTNLSDCTGYAPEPASTATCQFSASWNGTTLFDIIDPPAFGFTTCVFNNLPGNASNTLDASSDLCMGRGVWVYRRRRLSN